MSLYDYIGGNQVKVFFESAIYGIDEKTKTLNFGGSDGNLRTFNVGDEVPWKTAYYNYGKDFIVFDLLNNVWNPDSKENCVHEIRDGKVVASYPLDEIPEDLVIGNVFGKYGVPLNVKSIAGFKAIVADRKKADDMNKEAEKTSGIIDLFKLVNRSEDEQERLNALKKINQIRDEINEKCYGWFDEKWAGEDTTQANVVGTMIHSIVSGTIPADKLDDTLNMFKADIESNLPQMIDEYIAWQGDDVIYSREKIYEMLKIS